MSDESRISQFEAMVLDALVRRDPEESMLRAQIRESTVESRDYTGVGLFTKFAVPKTTPPLSASRRYIEEVPKTHLVHPKLKNGAGVLLWFEEGYVSTLECYAYEEDWPEDESAFTIDRRADDA